MRLVKLHRKIRFKSSNYVASYIANNTAKRQQFKHDDVKKALYKLMNNAPYNKTIKNVAQRIDIRLLNNMEKARKLAKKPDCWLPRIRSLGGAAGKTNRGRGRKKAATAGNAGGAYDAEAQSFYKKVVRQWLLRAKAQQAKNVCNLSIVLT